MIKMNAPTPWLAIFRSPALVAAITAMLITRPADAQDPTNRQAGAYQASVAQDGLRRDAAAIQNELTLLREQIRQLAPDDLPTIDQAIKQMDSLSREGDGARRPDTARRQPGGCGVHGVIAEPARRPQGSGGHQPGAQASRRRP